MDFDISSNRSYLSGFSFAEAKEMLLSETEVLKNNCMRKHSGDMAEHRIFKLVLELCGTLCFDDENRRQEKRDLNMRCAGF